MLIGKKVYKNVPRIFLTLIQNLNAIRETIIKTSAAELTEHWQQKATDKNKIDVWIKLVINEAKTISAAKHLDVKEMITESLR